MREKRDILILEQEYNFNAHGFNHTLFLSLSQQQGRAYFILWKHFNIQSNGIEDVL